MTKLLHGNEKCSLNGGREPLFSQKELLVLAIPLLVEQLLEGLDLRDAQNELVLRGAKKNAVKQAALRLKKLFTEDEE